MVIQLSHIFEECPVCGRPVEIRCEYLGRRVVCQHCGGGFAATEEGTQAREWMPKCERLMEAADRVLQTSAKCSATTAERLSPESCRFSFVKSTSDGGWPVAEHVTDEARQLYGEPAANRDSLADADSPRILLVEHRDDVFARLAASVAKLGFRVVRATTAWGALRCHAKQPFALVVANLDLPDQSGWLLTAKLRLIKPAAAVWVYMPCRFGNETSMAEFLQIDELFEYGGDLIRLADAVADRLAERLDGRPGPSTGLKEPGFVCDRRVQRSPVR